MPRTSTVSTFANFAFGVLNFREICIFSHLPVVFKLFDYLVLISFIYFIAFFNTCYRISIKNIAFGILPGFFSY